MSEQEEEFDIDYFNTIKSNMTEYVNRGIMRAEHAKKFAELSRQARVLSELKDIFAQIYQTAAGGENGITVPIYYATNIALLKDRGFKVHHVSISYNGAPSNNFAIEW